MKNVIHLILLLFITTLARAQVKNVLLEEFSGAWCGYCPEAQFVIDDIDTLHPGRVVFVAYHGYDTMQNQHTIDLRNAYTISSFPDGMVDRKVFTGGMAPMNRAYWKNAVNSQLTSSTPLDITPITTFDSTTNLVTVTADVHFYNAASGIFYLNICLIENDVHDTAIAFAQTNYYNIVVGHQAYGLGNPILNYKHNYVHRESLTPLFGDSTVIPLNAAAGMHYIATYTTTIAAGNIPANMKVVAFVTKRILTQMPAEAIVLNVNSRSVINNSTGIDGIENANCSLNIYPNPANNFIKINFFLKNSGTPSILIYDSYGRKIKTISDTYLQNGIYSENLDISGLDAGLYFIELKSKTENSVKRFLKID